MTEESFIGVDVCKARLDVVILPTGEVTAFDNTQEGIQKFLKYLQDHRHADYL